MGDLVYARPELLPDAELHARRITKTFERHAVLWEVEIGGRVIETTSEHPFYVVDRGWTPGVELRVGDMVVGHDGQSTRIDRIAQTTRGATVYNITVDEDHTYFVGGDDWEFSVWVHNQYQTRAAADGTFEIIDDAGNVVESGFADAAAASTRLGEMEKIRKANDELVKANQLAGKVDQVAPRPPLLPPFRNGGKTSGVLRTPNGDIPLTSGWNGPAISIPKGTSGFDIVTRTHVEGHAAAYMRQHGLKEATIYINNPSICQSCAKLLEQMIPKGSTLKVVLPDGTIVPFTRN